MTTPPWPTEEPRLPPYQDPQSPPPYQPYPTFPQHDGYVGSYPMSPVWQSPALPPALPPAPIREPRQPSHAWGFGAFLLAEAVFLASSFLVPLVAVLLMALDDPGLVNRDGPLPAPALIAALTIPPLLAAAVGLLATKIRGNGPVVDLKLRFRWRDVGIGLACGVAGVAVSIPVAALWAIWVGEENANSAVGQIFDGMQLPPVLAMIVFIDVWLIAPICEEILYRGLLWGAMERRRWNAVVILLTTTVVFAVAHIEPLRAPLLLAIGLPMGIARLWSGRLTASIVAHQVNNFLPALGLLLALTGVSLS